MPKWVLWGAVFFALFVIFTRNGAATEAAGYGEAIVQMVSGLAEFLSGLLNGVTGSSTVD